MKMEPHQDNFCIKTKKDYEDFVYEILMNIVIYFKLI